MPVYRHLHVLPADRVHAVYLNTICGPQSGALHEADHVIPGAAEAKVMVKGGEGNLPLL